MRYYRNLLHISIVSAFLLFPLGESPAQTAVNQQLNLAKMLETSGNYEAALQFYLQSYRKGDISYQTISGIKKCYVALGQFEQLIAFWEEFLRRHPQQIYYKVDLGSAYYWNNQKEKAFALWKDVLRQNKQNPVVYRRVASAMINFRLYDEAIEVYRQAMRSIKKQEMLYRDIAQLYKAQLSYRQAADNFVRYYLFHPKQMSYVRSQLVSMARDSLATREIIRSLQTFLDDYPDDYALNEMLGDMYIRAKNFDRAFAIYEKLLKKKEKQNYLQRFAREAEANGAFSYAAKAYRLLIATGDNSYQRQNWSVLLARNLYRLSKKVSDEQARAYLQEAVDLLTGLEDGKTGRTVARKALELHARILRESYRDYNGAITLYKKILRDSGKPYQSENDRIRLLLAEIYIQQNDLDAARQTYKKIKDKNHSRTARYRLAELCYYEADFDCAKKAFNELLMRLAPKDTLTNNVLDRVVFLELFAGDSLALVQFSRAELLQRQKKPARAAALFAQLAGQKNTLQQKAGLRAARLYMRLNRLDEAEKVLSSLLRAGLAEEEQDEIHFLLARVKEKEQDIKAALDHYRTVFVHYPASLYSEEARERARELSRKINMN
ncbi:MAG TPA: tetratricopeptide repeat protein [Caldithrix abyssi]|uniref:Tetratricopeptide repeat protein n=1 Tax=Caldithrix abyssi TaxID=187145 RepID=A0A7V4TYZ0_CALAY|nr:tetratricopeptide repeat protein [Caldithrix abyssi]